MSTSVMSSSMWPRVVAASRGDPRHANGLADAVADAAEPAVLLAVDQRIEQPIAARLHGDLLARRLEVARDAAQAIAAHHPRDRADDAERARRADHDLHLAGLGGEREEPEDPPDVDRERAEA